MMGKVKIAPSILSADFTCLGAQVEGALQAVAAIEIASFGEIEINGLRLQAEAESVHLLEEAVTLSPVFLQEGAVREGFRQLLLFDQRPESRVRVKERHVVRMPDVNGLHRWPVPGIEMGAPGRCG